MTHPTIRAHAQRLGLSPEQLSAALLEYATRELGDWITEQENADQGAGSLVMLRLIGCCPSCRSAKGWGSDRRANGLRGAGPLVTHHSLRQWPSPSRPPSPPATRGRFRFASAPVSGIGSRQ